MSTSTSKQRIDAVITANGKCKISPIRLWRFRKRATYELTKAMKETYRHFPVDTSKLAKLFANYYFSSNFICKTLVYPSIISTTQLTTVRKRFLKKGLGLNIKEALKVGVVAQQFPLKSIITTKSINPTRLSCYHPSVKNLDNVVKAISALPIPCAMFSVPLDSRAAQMLFSKPENSPNYTQHKKTKGRNPIVFQKNGMLLSTHFISAVITTIDYTIRTYVNKSFTRWELYFSNKSYKKDPILGINNDGSISFNFGSAVYIQLNVLRKTADNQGSFETHTLVFNSNASWPKNILMQWGARAAYKKITNRYNASMYTRKLYALEREQKMITQKSSVAKISNPISKLKNISKAPQL
ncbi:MAG: hypothetical protein ABIE74_11705 [Pseudomonadota bacterium]